MQKRIPLTKNIALRKPDQSVKILKRKRIYCATQTMWDIGGAAIHAKLETKSRFMKAKPPDQLD